MARDLGMKAKVSRLPTWNPLGLLIDRTWLEPVEVATGNRISLPMEVRKCLQWPPASEYLSLLAIIRDDGAVELVPWEPKGRIQLERVAEALAKDLDGQEEMILAAMDRYQRVALLPDGRLRLPRSLQVHLGAAEGQFVRVAATAGQLCLWPERIWEASRRDRSQKLDRILREPSRFVA